MGKKPNAARERPLKINKLVSIVSYFHSCNQRSITSPRQQTSSLGFPQSPLAEQLSEAAAWSISNLGSKKGVDVSYLVGPGGPARFALA